MSTSERTRRLDRYRAMRQRIAPRTSIRAFERLVTEAMDELPAFVRDRLDNVALVVEEWPPDDRDLLGLYEGTNQVDRPSSYHATVPDRITIFRQPILEEVGQGGAGELRREVTATVRHEVAHYLGMDDAELDELEGRTR